MEHFKIQSQNHEILISIPAERLKLVDTATPMSERSNINVIYINGTGQEDLSCVYQRLEQRLGTTCPVFVCIQDMDWNADLSPWPAERAFAKGEDFAGHASEYLQILTEGVIPDTEHFLREKKLQPKKRILAGYSLAGLFALYAGLCSECFQGIVSVSGSLWYDGFLTFLQERLADRESDATLPFDCVYLSLGDRESRTANPRMSQVYDCTAKAEALLVQHGIRSVFELNPGNHFKEVPQRMEKGLAWIVQVSS